MASTRCQQITHSYTHNSIVELGFQFPTHPNPSDASVLGCAAHLNLSAMDASASVNDLRSQVPPAVGQGVPSARTASPSEDGEIFDPDDDLPSLTRILARPKQVIDLTLYDDDDDGVAEVSWLRNLDGLDIA
jgi:hypothetical protein